MLTITIQDEQLAQQLQEIAERENRPVEDVLRTMVNYYPAETQPVESPAIEAVPQRTEAEQHEAIRRVRQKVYAEARAYWRSIGDTTKAAMTDAELDEQFGAFDEEGIPRLKSELTSLEPPPGSLAYAAKIARNSRLRSGDPYLAERSREILDQHFADDLRKRMDRKDAGE
jgi:hypothetical protein